MKDKFIRIFESIAAGLLCFVITYFSVFSSLDSLYQDKLYQIPRGMNQKIKIISIDEKTLAEYGPFNTWDRSIYNSLLEKLGDYPSVIAFDIMFMGNMNEESDTDFRNSIEVMDNVIVGSHLMFDTELEYDEKGNLNINKYHVKDIEMPYMADVVTTGFTNVSTDEDSVVRHVIPGIEYTDSEGNLQKASSLSYQIYKNYCERNNIAVEDYGYNQLNVYYAGRPYDYEAVSLCDVVDGKVDSRVFTGCIVLVGAYVTGLQDQFSVPNSNNQMYGVEINANIVQCFMENAFPKDVNILLISLLFAVLAAVMFYVFSRLHIGVGTIVFASVEVLSAALGVLLYTKGKVCVPMIYLNLILIVDYVATLLVNYIKEKIAKKKISNAFRKYVAPQVVDDIMKTGQYKIKLGGETKDIAVLFVDIRGFTPLSESLPPEKVVEILNKYLNLTTSAVFKNDGTLDKFIGDATMAVFNAPFDLEDYEYKAICAAFDIVAGAKELEEVCQKEFGRKVQFGVGVNCGEAVVGNIGCDVRMDYTAIGDTVNTAARLEANAKAGQVLISKEIYERVKDRITVNEIGRIPLKGKVDGAFVYELVDIVKREEKEMKEESDNE